MYDYPDVPAPMFEQLHAAASKGQFVN